MVIVIDMIVAFFIILIPFTFSEVKITKVVQNWNYLINIFKVIKEKIITNKKLFLLILLWGLFYWFYNSALRLYQPYFVAINIPLFWFGIILASFQIFSAFSGKYSYKVEHRLGAKKSIFLIVLLIGWSFILMSLWYWIGILWLVFAYINQFTRWFHKIAFSDYINKLTTSDIRATTISIHSLAWRWFYALIIPFVGMIVDGSSIFIALFFTWLATMVVCTPFLLAFSKAESRKQKI